MKEIKVRRSYEKEGFREPVFEYRADWPYISIGFGNERDYFIENLSLLIASGMGISSALSSISTSVKTWKMKKITKFIEDSVNAGSPLWKAFEETNFFPARIISLVRSGEEAGRLPEHLNLITVQQHKEKVFKSRLRSALLYPGIVLFLAFVIALGSTWIILPKLVSLFSELKGELPWTTQLLISAGSFFETYGLVAVPSLIAGASIFVYLLFFNQKTKFIGDFFLFRTPNIRLLVQGIELSRFGYIFGALLQAGFQPTEALESLKQGTNYKAYAKFYDHLSQSIMKGDSFEAALKSYHNADIYIPIPIQQLIISAEKSGKIPETFIRIGIIFEEKTDSMSQDLATVLEPIVLVIVGLVVGLIVSGILGPIYGLSNQL